MKINKIIIIDVLVLIVVISTILLVKFFKQKPTKEEIKEFLNPLSGEKAELNDSLEAGNFKIFQSTETNRWNIQIVITNNSNEETRLEEYDMILYDENNQFIKSIEISVPISIKPHDTHTLVLEEMQDVSNTKKIKFEKK